MSWSLLLTVLLATGLLLVNAWLRRSELRRMERTVREREQAQRLGSAEAKLQHPIIDLSRCLGCGTCVEVCPEDGVLEMVHGQATVVNGARCVGVAACERECPVGAITVTIANLETRRDVPVLDESLEAVGSPGLFLAGEVTAHALIKAAVEHGVAVGAEVARRLATDPPSDEHTRIDLCIVGAGPAGLACALEAKRLGVRAVVLEQEQELGGTVAKYPRRKLVVTLPVELPLHGRLGSGTYSKEELMDLWRAIAAEQELPIRYGEVFAGVQRDANGEYLVRTQQHQYRSRFVCLAIGRRGVPTKLGVPGEDLPKVAYSLLDAHSYQGRRVLVVGGGDSALETALALAEQPGNEVTISYRKEQFFRVTTRNEQRLRTYLERGQLRVVYASEVVAIGPDTVELAVRGGRPLRLANDDVFVMAGGVPPFEMLEQSGVSFDPALRKPVAPLVEQGAGFWRAMVAGFLLSAAALVFALWHLDYYALPLRERVMADKHDWLRPSSGVGLALGIAAVVLIVCNLLYLLRRGQRLGFRFGSLQTWMTSHVATGILALLCALLHGAMEPRDTPGGHAFWALVVLLVTGAIGRYFYSYVPRAANGRELELAEVKARLARVDETWDQGQQHFRQRARQRIETRLAARQWRGTFLGRVLALVGVQFGLRRLLAEIAADGRADGIAAAQVLETVQLARSAWRTALMAAHYEDLRAILASWRYLHRWVAALMVLLVLVHILHSLAYGSFFAEHASAPGSGR